MAKKIIWDSLYTDLPTHVAVALRTARIKPEQIIAKEDGELMAIEGIKEEDVNSIRAIYNADSVAVPTKEEKVEEAKEEIAEEAEKVAKKIVARKRSNKYKAMAKQVKKEELYSVKEAVETLAKLAKSTKLKTV